MILNYISRNILLYNHNTIISCKKFNMKHECNLIDSPYFPKWPQNIIYNLFLIWEPVKDHTLHLVVISPLIENKFSFFFFFPLSSTFLKSLGPLPCRMSHTQLVFDCVLMITFRVNIFGKNIA